MQVTLISVTLLRSTTQPIQWLLISLAQILLCLPLICDLLIGSETAIMTSLERLIAKFHGGPHEDTTPSFESEGRVGEEPYTCGSHSNFN